MVTEREQQIIIENKLFGFGAYLAWEWLAYPEYISNVSVGVLPGRETMLSSISKMDDHRMMFNLTYLSDNSPEPIDPLQLERSAWELLSPIIGNHVKIFMEYAESFNPNTADKQTFLALLQKSWDLLQKWNVISQSYKAKLEQSPERIVREEQKLSELIESLRSAITDL